MKRTVFAFFLCFAVFAGVFSQTKQESIKELIHIMKNDSMINKTIDAMVPSMVNQMQSQLKDSTARARSVEIMKAAMESAKELAPKITEEMVVIYDKYFTEKEISDFIVFYKSPSGQKYISVMPEIMKDLMGDMMKNYIPEMQKSLKAKLELAEELKKKQN